MSTGEHGPATPTARDDAWRETKFTQTRAGLRGSRDERWVGRGSRLIADLLAPEYERALSTYARGDLLDVGCGAAPLYGTYRSRVSSTTWVDWKQQPDCPPLDIVHDVGSPFPFAAGTFDTILATDVIEHLPEPERFFREMSRLLRPSGHLVVGAPFLYWIHEAPHDYHRYTRFRLAQLCEGAGLGVRYLRPYGGAMEVLLDITAKLAAPSRAGSLAHALITRLLLRSPMARFVRDRSTDLFPLGYVLVPEK